MATYQPSKLLGLLEAQATALLNNDYHQADRLSHNIDTFIQECTPGSLPLQERERIAKSFGRLELILASQRQGVSQQLQSLRKRKRMLKPYHDQAKT